MIQNKEKVKKEIIRLLKEDKTLTEISQIVFNTKTTALINDFLYTEQIKPYEYSDRYLFMCKEWLEEQLNIYGTPLKICRKFNMPRTSVTRYAIRYNLYSTKFSREFKNYINEDYFKNIDTSEKAYWLGFIMADGCITRRKNNGELSFIITIQQSDHNHLIKMAKAFDFDPNKIKKGSKLRRETTCYYSQIRTYNQEFCKNLYSHGIIERKSGYESLPKEIPDNLIRDFVRGFYDGDGNIDERQKSVTVSSMSKQILIDIQRWFLTKNIETTPIRISIQKSKKEFYSLYVRHKSLPRFADYIYYDGCISLDRKQLAINNIKQGLQEK